MTVRFVLVCEGSSDAPLVEPLETLCLRHGATEVSGEAPDLRLLPRPVGKQVEAQVAAALELVPEANLVFIHRDADADDPSKRRDEIMCAMATTSYDGTWVPLVPVQATEAWLLLDEAEIRQVSGNPKGNVPLDLPTPSRVETITRPKDVLFDLLIRASEKSGRHLDRFKKSLASHRRRLIERLDIDGDLSTVPSWRELDRLIGDAISKLGD